MNPVNPAAFVRRVIDPGLDWVATHGSVHNGRAQVRLLLTAYAIQESNLEWRAQIVSGDSTRAGPARSWWQIEEPTVGLLMRNPATSNRLRSMCEAAWVRFERDDIWRAIEGHDLLAFGCARLILWADPRPLPITREEAWECYAHRTWRPGKPAPHKWPSSWSQAQAAVMSS